MRTELVTTLRRKATQIIEDVEANQGPILITQHGRPAAYLLGVESYEKLAKRLTLLESIALGEQAITHGRTVTHSAAKKQMSRWLR